MKTEYIVTAKPGLTPFATVTTKRDAAKESAKARRLGLDGEIITIGSILSELRDIANESGLDINFYTEDHKWFACDFKGRQLWGGTLAEVRRVAAGKQP